MSIVKLFRDKYEEYKAAAIEAGHMPNDYEVWLDWEFERVSYGMVEAFYEETFARLGA